MIKGQNEDSCSWRNGLHRRLRFEAVPEGRRTKFVQTATYAPKGLLGTLYWYVLFPVHLFLFGHMAARITQGAEAFEKDISKMPRTV